MSSASHAVQSSLFGSPDTPVLRPTATSLTARRCEPCSWHNARNRRVKATEGSAFICRSEPPGAAWVPRFRTRPYCPTRRNILPMRPPSASPPRRMAFTWRFRCPTKARVCRRSSCRTCSASTPALSAATAAAGTLDRRRRPGPGHLQGAGGSAGRSHLGRKRRAGPGDAVHVRDSGGRGGRRRRDRRGREPLRLAEGRAGAGVYPGGGRRPADVALRAGRAHPGRLRPGREPCAGGRNRNASCWETWPSTTSNAR